MKPSAAQLLLSTSMLSKIWNSDEYYPREQPLGSVAAQEENTPRKCGRRYSFWAKISLSPVRKYRDGPDLGNSLHIFKTCPISGVIHKPPGWPLGFVVPPMISVFPPSIINRQEYLDQLWKRSSTLANRAYASRPLSMEKTRLFALLIGINNYSPLSESKFPALRGAVPDALAFQAYLENGLGVPHSQIVVLTDEDATRSAIIDALKNLADDERIDPGDAILIYYAGHGTEMDAPVNWESGGPSAKIQAIVPYDGDVVVESGQRVAPIPDRVLEVLLYKIAEKKGDNITVIFDCCHAASGTRAISSDGLSQVRSVEIPPRVYPEQLDSDIMDSVSDTRGSYTASRFKYRGLGSHILLAACSATQLAIERNGHGRFSAALLKLLGRVPPDKLRYSEILRPPNFDHIPDQHPQCEGIHTERTLFNAKVLPTRRKSFSVSYDMSANNGHGQYVVHGGTIHNITLDCEFAIYLESDVQLTEQIGVLHVDKLQPFSFMAKVPPGAPRFDVAHPTLAILTKSGRRKDLRIHVPRNDGFRNIYDGLAKTEVVLHDFESITFVEELQYADVQVRSPHEDTIRFTLRTPSVGDVSSHEFSHTVDIGNPDILPGILSKMVHFYRELKCIDNDPKISRHIDIEFYKLQATYEIDPATGFQEERLEPVGPNLYANGFLNVVVSDEDGDDIPYGVKLTNKSTNDLHANLFYFNNSDLSISTCVKSHASYSDRALDVPLKKRGGTLAVGYGAAGYLPMCFEITNGSDIDVGFLKIYLSTQPVNMVHLPQLSPFSSTRAMTHYRRNRRPPVSWTDIVVPIVQSRRQ